MRAIIDIPSRQDRWLKQLSRQRGVSRAQLVREAIDQMLERHHAPDSTDAFGVWKNKVDDGLMYERKLRQEWPT